MGDAYLLALGRFGCPRFANLPRRYIDPIRMHAGVPKHSLNDLVDLIQQRLDADSHLDGIRLLQWLGAPGHESRLAKLGKPVQRFLELGGEFAVDWADRLIDLVARLRVPAADLTGVLLPDWVVEHVRQHRLTNGATRREPRNKIQAPDSPQLRLDPYSTGVHILLPSILGQSDGVATWHLVLDGTPYVIQSRTAWAGGTERIPSTLMALPRPVRTATITLDASNRPDTLDIVDPQDPILIFGEDGCLIPSTSPLPPASVWILRPSDRSDLEAEGEPQTLVQGSALYGWGGWVTEQVDLTDVRRLRLGSGAWRNVQRSRPARLEVPDPVVGATSTTGGPIYSSPPVVSLPDTEGNLASWSITVRRPGEPPLVQEEIESAIACRVDVFERVPRPLVGPYQVVVRGPLGRGVTRLIELIEGLVVTTEPPWREFANNGLVPCRVHVAVGAGLESDTPSRQLNAMDDGFITQVSGGGTEATIQISPPHMSARVLVDTAPGLWVTGPVRLETETLHAVDAIALRLPPCLAGRARAVLLHGLEETQSTAVTINTNGTGRVDVRRFTDTLEVTGSGWIYLEVLGHRTPLAVVRPRRLASGAWVDSEGMLRLRSAANVAGLAVGIYTILKPWREPLEMSADAIAQSWKLTGEGPLLVHLRVADPWAPEAWPSWPPAENTFRCDAPLEPPSGGWEDAVASWLAGRGTLPTRSEAAPALMAVYGLSDALMRAKVHVPVRAGVAAALRSLSLRELTNAVRETQASTSTITAALVDAGAVWAPSETPSALPDATAWARSALAAVLSISSALRLGEEVAKEDLVRAAGPVADTLLTGQHDPHPSAGRFGPETLRLDKLSKEALEGIWRAANIVPTQLLDADSRAAAARQLFDTRHHPDLQALASKAKRIAVQIATLLSEQQRSALAGALQARFSGEGQGWQWLPALSLALALLARITARGDEDFTEELELYRTSWAELARHAPDLVALDLILAECLLLGDAR